MTEKGKYNQMSHQGLRQRDLGVAAWEYLKKLPKGGVKLWKGKAREGGTLFTFQRLSLQQRWGKVARPG